MFLDRRGFLGASVGMGLGISNASGAANVASANGVGDRSAPGPMPKEYEEILARTQQLTYLGRPKSWWVVRQGFLPIAPERVLILEPTKEPWHKDAGDRWSFPHRETKEKVRERLTQRDISVAVEQLGLIVRLTSELARYYDVLELCEEWAYRMAAREWLGSTCIGRQIAVPHQYQVTERVNTVNSHIDWWLVLIPNGTNCWGAFDEQPVHVMFTHVFSRPFVESPGNYLPPLCLLSMGIRELPDDRPEFFVRLSRMHRVSAARLMNQYIVQALREEPVWRYA